MNRIIAGLAGGAALLGGVLMPVAAHAAPSVGWEKFVIRNSMTAVERATAMNDPSQGVAPLFTGRGTFTQTADPSVLDANFGGCTFIVTITPDKGDMSGNYLIWGAGGTCKNMIGSGEYKVAKNGSVVAVGPVRIKAVYEPSPPIPE